jgi:ABC-2 type transport system ATP-binding protein
MTDKLLPAIRVDGVSKTFKLPHEKQSSIKGMFINFARRKRGYEIQKVLDNVSLEITPGDFFGIVGRNGSGKSTLLKLLAGIYTPTEGSITINGKLTPFIELGVGFNQELSGRDNVFLNGALLGFSRAEMLAMYDEIVAFAELEKFMDQKLKNYSSGMQVRLAFAIAIKAKTSILLLDEVLAVGDLDFQKKCYDYFYQLKRDKQTVILVTHDMSAVRKFCTKSALISNGKINKIGTPDEVAELYEEMNLRAAEKQLTKQHVDNGRTYKREGNQAATIEQVETFNVDSGEIQNTFNAQEKIGVRITCVAHESLSKPAVGFIFQDQEDITVFATNNVVADVQTKALKPNDQLTYETVIDNVFTDGKFTVTCAIESSDFKDMYDRISYIHTFMIGGHKLPHATAHAPHVSKVSYKANT